MPKLGKCEGGEGGVEGANTKARSVERFLTQRLFL